MKQLFRIRTNKKGASLIYVVIASAALLILSGVVAVSAMRNMDLTGNNYYSRYAYNRDKSAIEFAKGILKQEYEAAENAGGRSIGDTNYIKRNYLRNFAVITAKVTPYGCDYNDSNSYIVNGKDCFATCKIESDKNTDYKYAITVTAGYPANSANKKKLLTMKYKTTCTLSSDGETEGFPYILYGTKYGSNPSTVVNGNTPTIPENTNGQGISAYPLVFNLPVQITTGGGNSRLLQAPEIFFMGGPDTDDNYCLNGKGGDNISNAALYTYNSGKADIKSDFIYIASDRICYKPDPDPRTAEHLNLYPLSQSVGYIYFANAAGCTIYRASDNDKIKVNRDGIETYTQGLYSYGTSGKNILSRCNLTAVTNANTIVKVLKKYGVKYVKDNHAQFASAEASYSYTQPYEGGKADWVNNGRISGSTQPDKGYDAFFYATDASKWSDGGSYNYSADKISFMYVNSDPTIIIGSNKGSTHIITFNADAVSFCGQKADGDGDDSTDGLTLMQGDSSGKFILNSSSGNGSVTLTVYHKLIVERANGTSYSLNSGTYTVTSGTDLFNGSLTSSSFTPGSDVSGDDGSSGSVTGGFSGGEYSW